MAMEEPNALLTASIILSPVLEECIVTVESHLSLYNSAVTKDTIIHRWAIAHCIMYFVCKLCSYNSFAICDKQLSFLYPKSRFTYKSNNQEKSIKVQMIKYKLLFLHIQHHVFIRFWEYLLPFKLPFSTKDHISHSKKLAQCVLRISNYSQYICVPHHIVIHYMT